MTPETGPARLLRACLSILLLGLAGPIRLPAQCDESIDLGRGPINFHVPAAYDPAVETPLVVVLHTFGGSGELQESYLRMRPMADAFTFLYAYPDGTLDADGDRFWNATDVCCDNFGSGVDDSAYLRTLIETIAEQCNVDRRRIYLIGQSNGAYMSYRMACDHADTLSTVVPLAGATFFDPEQCDPSRPVNVLHIHGTEDETWLYEGGVFNGNRYPGAVRTVETWATYNGCTGGLQPVPGTLDLEADVPGAESRVSRYLEGCSPGGAVELWTTEGGPHIAALPADFRLRLIAYLLARPAPHCTGAERVTKAVCRGRRNKLVLKLANGLPGDGFEVELASGQTRQGRLDARGRATVRFVRVGTGRVTVAVGWGCGASSVVAAECR